MKTWQDRLKTLLKEHSLTQEDLAEKLNVTQSSIGHWINKRRTPSYSHLEEISKVFGITTKALLFGDELELGENIPIIIKKIPVLSWEDFLNKGLSIEQILQQREQKGEVFNMVLTNKNKNINKNKIGAIQAKNVEAMLPSYPHKLAVFEGDWLIIDFEQKPIHGNLVIAKVKEGLTIRQYVEDAGTKILQALNIQYPIITDFEIIGTVINILKNV